MAALCYVLLPLSGLFGFLEGGSVRVRAHGAQAILLGLLWPVALYGASYIGSAATRIVFAAGGLLWLVLIVATAVGADLLLPAMRKVAARAEP